MLCAALLCSLSLPWLQLQHQFTQSTTLPPTTVVCLHDWWLIMAENDFQGKRLAVAGLTSREQQAVRVFSSAPILKRYDVFTLETVDGIFVLIKGFINKDRTKENGFPSEVFNHFVFGFPPFWEEYAEKCLGEGFSNEDVSRSTSDHDKLSTDSGITDFSEETPNRNKKGVSGERHDSGDKMDLSSEDSGNMFSTKKQHKLQDGASNESSVEDPKICSSQVVSEMNIGSASTGFDLQNDVTDSFNGVEDEFHVNIGSGISNGGSKGTVERFPLTSKIVVHPGSTAGPVNRDVCDVESDTIDPPLSFHSDRNTVNSFEVDIAVQPKHVGSCVAISCERKDLSKSDGKGKKRTRGESEREGSDNLIILNDNVNLDVASIESPLRKRTNVSKVHRCKYTKAVPLETSGMNLKSSAERSESPRTNYKDEEKVMLGNVSANLSTIKLSLNPEAGKQRKKTNKALKSSIGLGDANLKEDLEIGVSKKETNDKKASKSSGKTKRKLTYESPVSQGGTEKASFISPESLSFKRSRSGRLLLPTLQFWRNQMPIYDKDRQITGIREGEGLRGVEPSRGSRSEPQR
ncbi:kinetochore-associated protein KNL-2 homolog isoform X2 [Camellia sinensis]|uniref:kinetochore-associated protein KNL-2 homolog isoform X2 n=1 Tax=Camellia sinensis TaxID=4442 RepID=UPI0010367C7A|nr:kinetochore-associated protein KNL-2 homolog isoform X2 [Camellia sinensis]